MHAKIFSSQKSHVKPAQDIKELGYIFELVYTVILKANEHTFNIISMAR